MHSCLASYHLCILEVVLVIVSSRSHRVAPTEGAKSTRAQIALPARAGGYPPSSYMQHICTRELGSQNWSLTTLSTSPSIERSKLIPVELEASSCQLPVESIIR